MRSATELAAAIRQRELGPVEAHIETIERRDPLVNAVVVRCFERARTRVARPVARRRRSPRAFRSARGGVRVTMLKTLRPDLGAYLDAGRRLNELQSEADEWMERHPIALCPVTPVPAKVAAMSWRTLRGGPPTSPRPTPPLKAVMS